MPKPFSQTTVAILARLLSSPATFEQLEDACRADKYDLRFSLNNLIKRGQAVSSGTVPAVYALPDDKRLPEAAEQVLAPRWRPAPMVGGSIVCAALENRSALERAWSSL